MELAYKNMFSEMPKLNMQAVHGEQDYRAIHGEQDYKFSSKESNLAAAASNDSTQVQPDHLAQNFNLYCPLSPLAG